MNMYVGFNINISEGVIPNSTSTIANSISIEVFNFLNYLKSKYGTNGTGIKITDIDNIGINIVSNNMYYNNGGNK